MIFKQSSRLVLTNMQNKPPKRVFLCVYLCGICVFLPISLHLPSHPSDVIANMERSRLSLPEHQPLKPLYKLHCSASDSHCSPCQSPRPSHHLLVGESETAPLQPRYEFIKQVYVDSGATTIIDLYQDSVTDTNVVIKKVSKTRFFSEALRESAYRELTLHRQLQHVNIVQLYDTAETAEHLLLLLEYVPRHDYFTRKLEELNMPFSVKPNGGVQKLKSFCFDILSALYYLHFHGIIHMDLKPSNLLLQPNVDPTQEYPLVKMCDFGLARQVGSDGHVTLPWKCGSDQYRAPEVKDGANVTCAVDMWSFGIFLHRLSVGFRPHDLGWKPGETIPFPARQWRKFANTGLTDLLARCLEKDPTRRISAEEALSHPFLTSRET